MIGHSEGGLVGILTARRIPVDKLVLLAVAARKQGDLLKAQLEKKLPPDKFAAVAKAIDAIMAGEIVDPPPPGLAIPPSLQSGIASAFREDPIPPLQKIEEPILIVAGGRDSQLARLDFLALTTAAFAAKTLWVPEMNHVLVDVSDEADDLAAYNQPERPLDADMIAVIADFILDEALAHGPESVQRSCLVDKRGNAFARTIMRKQLKRLALQQPRHLAGQPGGLADEQALQWRRAVDQAKPDVTHGAQQGRFVGEQEIQRIGREPHRHGVETPPALIALEHVGLTDIHAEPRGIDHDLGQCGDVLQTEIEALARDRMDHMGGVADERHPFRDERTRDEIGQRKRARLVERLHLAEMQAEALLELAVEIPLRRVR